MRMLRPMVGALAAVLVSASYARAQACTGNTPFANGRYSLGVVGSFAVGSFGNEADGVGKIVLAPAPQAGGLGSLYFDKLSRYGVVGAYGAPKSWYATATIGGTTGKQGGSTLTDFSGTFGYQIPVGDSPLEVCPYAHVGYAKRYDVSTTAYGVGGAIGWPNHVSDDFDFIPAVGLQYNGTNTSFKGSSLSLTDNFTSYYFDAGLIFNKQWAVIPGVSKNSRGGSKAVFTVAITYNFGK